MNRSSKYKLRKLLSTFQDSKMLKDNYLDKRLIVLYIYCLSLVLQYFLHEKILIITKNFLLQVMKTTHNEQYFNRR